MEKTDVYKPLGPQRKPFLKWQMRTILITMIGYAIFYFVRKNFSLAMPGLTAEYGITNKSFGWIIFIGSLVYGFSRFINGYLVDKIKGRIVMALGLFLCAVANFAFGFGVNLSTMITGTDHGADFTSTFIFIMGIIIGALGPKLHFISYTTRSASLMLRKLGLSLYLACLGLDAGKDFFGTVMRPQGLLWVGIGALITIVPVLIVGLIALKTKKFDFGTICGILCGSMANPMALGYANDTLRGDTASISYASVYPLGMFVRVIIAQILVMFFV